MIFSFKFWKSNAVISKLAIINVKDQTGIYSDNYDVCAIQVGSLYDPGFGRSSLMNLNSYDFCSLSSYSNQTGTSVILVKYSDLNCTFKTIANNVQINRPLYAMIGTNNKLVNTLL